MALGRARRTLPGCVGLRDAPGRVERAGAGPSSGTGRRPRPRPPGTTSHEHRPPRTRDRSPEPPRRDARLRGEPSCLLLFNPHGGM